MSEPPVPDLLDDRGRMRRLVLSFVIGVVVASIAFFICDRLATPDAMPGGIDGGSQRRAYQFVYYFSGVGFVGAFGISLLIQNHLAKRQWRRELVAPAKVRK